MLLAKEFWLHSVPISRTYMVLKKTSLYNKEPVCSPEETLGRECHGSCLWLSFRSTVRKGSWKPKYEKSVRFEEERRLSKFQVSDKHTADNGTSVNY